MRASLGHFSLTESASGCAWAAARCERYRKTAVIPGLVPGIQRSASGGASRNDGSGDKHRDDKPYFATWAPPRLAPFDQAIRVSSSDSLGST